jgi:hypothetical protein
MLCVNVSVVVIATAKLHLQRVAYRISSELREHAGSCGVDSDFNNVPKPGYKHCDKPHERQKFIQPSASVSKHPSMISFNEKITLKQGMLERPHKGDASFWYYLINLVIHTHARTHTHTHADIHS